MINFKARSDAQANIAIFTDIWIHIFFYLFLLNDASLIFILSTDV